MKRASVPCSPSTELQAPFPSRVVSVPGDKSIAHRVFMVAAMRDGVTHIENVPDGKDVLSTIRVLQALGVRVVRREPAAYDVHGWGARGPVRPMHPLDCGNSGTTARLLMGMLAGWDIDVEIAGDDSLSRRPMGRVVKPLSLMGAHFEADRLPLRMRGTENLRGIVYDMPVASAQVKSAILLAACRAQGQTCVQERYPTRNHTELLLASGLRERSGEARYVIPGDPSSAAFLAVAALLTPCVHMAVENVCLNATRIGFLKVLERMGAHCSADVQQIRNGEPVGTLRIRGVAQGGCLQAVDVGPQDIATLIDEVPVLALVAACAQGETVFHGIGELRVKESDRIDGIIAGLDALGVRAFAERSTHGEALHIVGNGLRKIRSHAGEHAWAVPDEVMLDARGDHRLALTWLVAQRCWDARIDVHDAGCACISYPGFVRDMESILL